MDNSSYFSRIDSVFLPVQDVEKAVNWYTKNLGVELAWKYPAVASFRLGETPLTLVGYEYPGYEKKPKKEFQFQPVTSPKFNLYAPDIEAAHKDLRQRGIEVTDINNHGGVIDFMFKDLDGNVIAVVWWPEK